MSIFIFADCINKSALALPLDRHCSKVEQSYLYTLALRFRSLLEPYCQFVLDICTYLLACLNCRIDQQSFITSTLYIRLKLLAVVCTGFLPLSTPNRLWAYTTGEVFSLLFRFSLPFYSPC